MKTSAKESAKAKVGGEVLAYCTSCKMDLIAIVVSKVESKLSKVQCKTCKKEHTYKAPKGIDDPSKAPAEKPAKVKKVKVSKEEAQAAEHAAGVAQEWKKLITENKKPALKYSAKQVFQVGDVLEHPDFHQGIVMRLIHPNKMEVIFEDNLRIMIHSRL